MSVNILDQNGNLKKIAHGFSESKFNIFRSDVISNIEMTDTASKDYAVGDFLIMANGQLAQVTSPIYQDMTISLSNVRPTTVEEMIAAKADSADIPDVSKYQKIFTGTIAEWNQLTTEQKTAYDLANITDDLGTEADIVDAVSDGDMRAVTSNAVHDALESKISTSETTGLVKNDGSIDTKSYAEKVANGTENNLAGLDENGNLKDGGWSSDKTTTSATGNPISISGLKSNQLAINPVITFEPIQAGSGTPSPSNIRAISGYDKIEVLSVGKNIWDGTFKNAVLISGTTWNSNSNGRTAVIRIKASTYFTVSKNGGSRFFVAEANEYPVENGVYTLLYNGGDVSTGTGTIQTSANAKYLLVYCDNAGANNIQLQVEEGQTATTYEAPNKTTSILESLGQTVYGGSLDVRTGKLMVDRTIVDLGDLNWYYSGVFFYAELSVIPKIVNTFLNQIASKYKFVNGDVTTTDLAMQYYSGYLRIKFNSASDLSSFETAIDGCQLCYEIATPITIQLTPHEISLLKDYAYVSTNGTSITFDYHNGELASLADVAQLGETLNWICGSEQLEVVNIPYNRFAWDSTSKSFYINNFALELNRLVGIFVNSTNGRAIMSAYASSSQLFVMGWLPTTGSSVDGTYEFTCNVLYKRSE